jgi:DNA-binding transcriptional regulator GbsR (MarR family)
LEKIQLTYDQKKLIERLGVMHEKRGMQPAPSRVASLLLVADRPELTFDEIKEALGLSKSATSNAINNLLTANKIDYITYPENRKRYFVSKVTSWKEDAEQNLESFKELTEVLEEVLKQRPGNTTEFNANLREVIDFLNFLVSKLPELMEEWERTRNKR